LHIQSVSGGSTSSSSVSSPSISVSPGGGGNLYMASIATKPFTQVDSVSGLGLSWNKLIVQCSGRSQTGVSVWFAVGGNAAGTVTANLASTPSNAIIAVSVYNGVDTIEPIHQISAANTKGVGGGCIGGIDSSNYTQFLPVGDNSLLYSSVAIRSASNTPPSGFTERVEKYQGSGGDVAGIAVQDQSFTHASDVVFTGYLSTNVDWALEAIEIRGGAGSFGCNPPGDATGDGKVDLKDYIIWLNHYNSNSSAGCSGGDFNIGGNIDGIDYMLWRNNFGQTADTPTPTKKPTNTPTKTPNPTNTPKPTNTPSGPTPTIPVGGPYIPYSSNSFFKKVLPDNAPLDNESSVGISYVKSHNSGVNYPTIKGVGGNQWGTVYFEGKCSDSMWILSGGNNKVKTLETEGFHAPMALANAFTGTSDSPFNVMDRCGVPSAPNGLTVMGSGASLKCKPGSCSGTNKGIINIGASSGAFRHDSNGLAKGDPLSDTNYNDSSRGRIPDAMVIRKDRLDWAIANNSDLGYVLHIFWVETDASAGYVHPMTGYEGGKNGWGPEGIRIRVKASVNIEARNMTPAGKVIARTLQRHGAYLGDNAGNVVSLKAEQDLGQWGSLLHPDELKGLTWDDFEFVKRGWEP
jgi:hypothetical protein